MTTGVRVRIAGLERLTPGTTYVFVANHQSIYDIPVLFASLPYQLRIIAKDSLGRFPFLGWHLSRTGHLLVNRRKVDPRGVFEWANGLTARGLSLLVFPEGTRSADRARWARSRAAASIRRCRRDCRSCRFRWPAAGT